MGWSWYDDHIVIVFFSSRSLPFLSLFYSQLGSDFCQAHSVAIAIQVPSWMLLTSTTELWRPKQNREIPSIRTRVLDIAKTFAYLGGDFSFKLSFGDTRFSFPTSETSTIQVILVYWSGFPLLWTIWNSLLNLIWISTSFRGQRLLTRWQTVSEWQGIIIHCDKITYKKWKWNKT